MSARSEDDKLPKIDYSKITSGIIQRGEELFPLVNMPRERDYSKIKYCLEFIPFGGERLMSMEEILELYD